MDVKRWLALLVAGIVASPLAIGLMVLMVIVGSDDPERPIMAGSLAPGSVPEEFRQLILDAAAACDQGLSPAVLAAQLEVESGWDRDVIYNRDRTSPAGAQGIAQFIPGTWETWGEGGDPYNPEDAIPAQGRLMCSLLRKAKQHPEYTGSPVELALAGYNAGWGRVEEYRGVPPQSFAGGETYRYVEKIMDLAREMTSSGLVAAELPADFSLPSDTPPEIEAAISWALTNALGGNYTFGGSCTDPLGDNPEKWCDCSSLVQQAYRAGGIQLPRTTYDQVHEGRAVDIDSPKPGDLVFSPGSDGSEASPGHIGLYIGGGKIIESPRTGVKTRLVTYDSWRNADDYTIRISTVRRIVDW